MRTTLFRFSISCAAAMAGTSTSLPAQVNVTVDLGQPQQTWYGFGATHVSQVFGTTDVLTTTQRAQMIDLLFNQVKLRTGQIPGLFEAPQSSGSGFFGAQANDDGSAFNILGAGFNTYPLDTFRMKVVDLAPPVTTESLYPSQNINTRWASQWLETIRASDYNRFLDECAEQVLAGIQAFAAAYGREPAYDMLFNEPTTGNGELQNGTDAIITDIVKRAGARLRGAGFNLVKFVVPGQETENASLSTATHILNDPLARPYVGAIAFHPYPYGSTYSYIPNILATSGSGNPDASKVAVRQQLRALGQQYGIPVWMTEVSNGFYGDNTPANMESFDALRGRAIHIHDEIAYAGASAFFGMQSSWSLQANIMHGLGASYGSNPDDLVFTDQAQDRTFITGMGRAIGHYARFVDEGAIVLSSTSSDPLVQVTALRNVATARLVLVLVNNATQARNVSVQIAGATVTGDFRAEQSTAASSWQPLAGLFGSNDALVGIALPARSVTSLACPLTAATASPYCFGDGSATACPCGNASAPGDQAGCANSLGLAGKLTAGGAAVLSNDSLVLSAAGMPDSSALFFQGTAQAGGGAGTVFGDGLQCAGGSIVRLGTKLGAAGHSQYPGSSDASVSARGLVTSATTRFYQTWYRNAASFCTSSTFNLTNGLAVTWSP